MGKRSNSFLSGFARKGIYYLAIALMVFILLPPFLKDQQIYQDAILILNTFIIASSIIVVNEGRKIRKGHWLMLILVALPWVMDQTEYLNLPVLIIFFILYSFTSFRITEQIFKEKEVDLKVIVGSLVGYMMIGLAFTFLSAILVTFYTDAYSPAIDFKSSYSFVYYTFVTFSTLGYGDITPATPQAQALSILITISGQFYMVIIVAVIVGKFISAKKAG